MKKERSFWKELKNAFTLGGGTLTNPIKQKENGESNQNELEQINEYIKEGDNEQKDGK